MIVVRHEVKEQRAKLEDQIRRIRRDFEQRIKTIEASKNAVMYLNEALAVVERIPGIASVNHSLGYIREYGAITCDIVGCETIISVAHEFEKRGWWFSYDDLQKKPEEQFMPLRLWTIGDGIGINITITFWFKDGPDCHVEEYTEYEPVTKYRYRCG